MRALGRTIKFLSNGLAALGAIAIVLMMIQIAIDVTLRNLFNLSVPMTATLVTKWYMVAVAFLPLGLAELIDRHICVDVVYQQFSLRWRRIVGGAVCLLSFIVVCIMVIPLWGEAVEKMELGSFELENGRHLSIWLPFFFLPVGFAVFGAILLYRVVVLWTGMESGMEEVPIEREGGHDVNPAEGI